jgi:altronate dehydratase small subunit
MACIDVDSQSSVLRARCRAVISEPLEKMTMENVAILLDPADNVATALRDLSKGESVTVVLNDVTYSVILREDIAFGHKYALRDIGEGQEILKYGLPIGKALKEIRAGEWVHVHNCRSERFGFRHEQYGINA